MYSFCFYSQLPDMRAFCGSRVATGLKSGCEIKASMLRQSCGQNGAYVEFTTTSTTFASQPAHSFTDAWQEHDTDGVHSKPALAACSEQQPQPHSYAFCCIFIIYLYICIRMSILEMETTLDKSRQLNDTNPPAQFVTTCGVGCGWGGGAGQRSR